MDVAIGSFRVQRPFLADFADLSSRLRPAARELPRSLPAISRRSSRARRCCRARSVSTSRLEGALAEAEDLFENPKHTARARGPRHRAHEVSRPALEFIAPYQTVCNYLNYFIHPLGEAQSMVQAGPTGGAPS